MDTNTRPTRGHKTHEWDGAPLDLSDELGRLLRVYEHYPGIASDLRQLLADRERQADTRRSA